ncbi:MAG: hypothetical protein ACYTAN_06670 [Planctomycetota bacterium]|jgi:hypothetical protein
MTGPRKPLKQDTFARETSLTFPRLAVALLLTFSAAGCSGSDGERFMQLLRQLAVLFSVTAGVALATALTAGVFALFTKASETPRTGGLIRAALVVSMIAAAITLGAVGTLLVAHRLEQAGGDVATLAVIGLLGLIAALPIGLGAWFLTVGAMGLSAANKDAARCQWLILALAALLCAFPSAGSALILWLMQ